MALHEPQSSFSPGEQYAELEPTAVGTIGFWFETDPDVKPPGSLKQKLVRCLRKKRSCALEPRLRAGGKCAKLKR